MRLKWLCLLPVLSASLRLQKSSKTARHFDVDVVFTWIPQPSQPDYKNILQECKHLSHGLQRFRNLGTFRFSLRMIEKNMPWVRTIFVVSPNGTAPTWLNTDNHKIKVIDQQSLFPSDTIKRAMPVHNSQQVEVYLHKIPGLAEHFVYFNDDMFAGRPLQPQFFFSDDGKPIFRTRFNSNNVHHEPSWRNFKHPGSEMGNHIPYPLTISMIEEMQSIWPNTFGFISSAHCRGDLPISEGPGWLYQWFGIQSGSMEVNSTGRFEWLRKKNLKNATAWYEQQLSQPPDLFCINDDFETEDGDTFYKQMKDLKAFMEKMSGGHPSHFEREGANEIAVKRLHRKGPRGPVLLVRDGNE